MEARQYSTSSPLGSGVSAMYDRVSGTLFGNDGTGSFTIGPDV